LLVWFEVWIRLESLQWIGDQSGLPLGGIERRVTSGLRSLRGTGNKIAGGTGALAPRQSQIRSAVQSGLSQDLCQHFVLAGEGEGRE